MTRTQRLSVPDKHQLRIARSTMRMHCLGAAIMGGPNHVKAASIIKRLSGAIVRIDTDCTCEEAN